MKIFKRKADGKFFGVTYTGDLFEVELKYRFTDPWTGELVTTSLEELPEDEWEELI